MVTNTLEEFGCSFFNYAAKKYKKYLTKCLLNIEHIKIELNSFMKSIIFPLFSFF